MATNRYAPILFKISALYKSFTYLLTYFGSFRSLGINGNQGKNDTQLVTFYSRPVVTM